MSYLCPVCKNKLHLHIEKKYYRCDNNHTFDRAKEGYVNLLPVQNKHSKEPGDSKEMIRSRHQFLSADYYQPMAAQLAKIIDSSLTDQRLKVLDLGCGEGYYSRELQKQSSYSDGLKVYGLDIAKNAIVMAAKKQKNAEFIVASSNDLPYSDDFFDLVYRIYAPSNQNEVLRVLKSEGYLLRVTPGPRHLWQLKELLYSKANEHEVEDENLIGFELISKEHKRYMISPDKDERLALLQMTPFAWKADKQQLKMIEEKLELEIEVDFVFSLFRKKTAKAH